MHVDPILNSVRAALNNQLALGGDDPVVENVASMLIEALAPTLRQAAIDIAQQAAVEIGAQLNGQAVDVVLVDDDVELRVVDAAGGTARPTDDGEDLAARITLRLPPSLKQLIEEIASGDGESVNSFVIDALNRRAKRPTPGGKRVTEGFDL